MQKSNLDKHVKAVHEQQRPFVCRFYGCGKKFSYKHVRDNHEKSSAHVYVEVQKIIIPCLSHLELLHMDVYAAPPNVCRVILRLMSKGDLQQGGRKRKRITVESLMWKRVAAPDDAPAPEDGMEYLRWLLSG
jgi:general transcription factor IIIA